MKYGRKHEDRLSKLKGGEKGHGDDGGGSGGVIAEGVVAEGVGAGAQGDQVLLMKVLGLAMVSKLHKSLSQKQSFCFSIIGKGVMEVLHLLLMSPYTALYPAGMSVWSQQSLW